MKTIFEIRDLDEKDINQMANARKEQEIENGNGVTDKYIEKYKEIIKKLFKEKMLIAVGAFYSKRLVSLSCFNLINYGEEKKIPYLCAVWTDPQFRGKGLANRVNNELMENVIRIKKQLQPKTLLTLEGTDAAYNLYKKLGYEMVRGEMSFLGDVKDTGELNLDYKIYRENINETIRYSINNIPTVEITYSKEQFFPHPLNMDGKMYRIVSIRDLQGKLNKKSLNIYLQHFLQNHRFCKFNVNELLKNEKQLYRILELNNEDEQSAIEAFESFKFKGNNNQMLSIKRSDSVMERKLEREFRENGNRRMHKDNGR